MLWAVGGSNTDAKNKERFEPLTIIICAHNEAQNLQSNLPFVLQQDYPDFEIIVVNDASDDNSLAILEAFARVYKNLKIINIAHQEARDLPGKKFALSKAVAIAQHEMLLLCDADCKPVSNDWATKMALPLHQSKDIVAGYGAYKERKYWLNKFIRWETMHSFLQYSCYANSGMPYMAVGRNLACRKVTLETAQKAPIWSSMPSGDDDLLVKLMGKRKNVAIVSDPNSFTISEAKSNFSDWLKQKQRHISTGKLYKRNIQFLLGSYALTHGLMWLLWLILWLGGLGYLISSLMLLRCILVWSLWGITADNLREKKLILWLPFCDIAWAIYNLILSPYIFFKTKKQWT
jgi:glycosyltransferase involved in cell wall biosynthesis